MKVSTEKLVSDHSHLAPQCPNLTLILAEAGLGRCFMDNSMKAVCEVTRFRFVLTAHPVTASRDTDFFDLFFHCTITALHNTDSLSSYPIVSNQFTQSTFIVPAQNGQSININNFADPDLDLPVEGFHPRLPQQPLPQQPLPQQPLP